MKLYGTEIPLITGNNDIVGDFGFLYIHQDLQKILSNMMFFWSNFAKNGALSIYKWNGFRISIKKNNFLILKQNNMRIADSYTSYKELIEQLLIQDNELERCVILYQMGTFVGNDIFEDIKQYSNFDCDRKDAINFLEANASFIEY